LDCDCDLDFDCDLDCGLCSDDLLEISSLVDGLVGKDSNPVDNVCDKDLDCVGNLDDLNDLKSVSSLHLCEGSEDFDFAFTK
jgi:hypothetical protein